MAWKKSHIKKCKIARLGSHNFDDFLIFYSLFARANTWHKIIIACTTNEHIISVVIKRDGIDFRGVYQPLIKYGSDWNEVSSMCTNSGQLYVAHECGVDEVSLATLKVMRSISAGCRKCLIHTQSLLMEPELRQFWRVTASWNGLDVSKMFKFSLVMALQGIMMDLQQSVGAGFFSPQVSARNSTTWYIFVISKQAVSRYSQPLRKLQNSLRVSESCFLNFPFI